MKYYILFIVIVLLSDIFNAQNHHCGTDEMHQELFLNNVGLHQKIIENNLELEAFTQQFAQTYSANNLNKGVISYTIPVVFHVIHNHGAENVSTAQILDGLKILNEGYQKSNPDTANLISPFKEIAADCEIAFKLAQLDPSGNCTNGITRHVDSSTYTGLHHVKDIVHWDPSKYLNIYVCSQAGGLAGHALVPSAADTIPEWDGIVMQHSYMGSIGTGSIVGARVIVHEVGHYLNLQHIWGGNNVPNYPYLPVGDAGNCAFDDGVTDTPNTIGNSGQNLATSTCGSLDNMQNFMEYTYLNSMFTEGQKVRMHAALNSSIANRNNLWTNANLIATGIINNPTICAVNFETDKRYFCAGETVKFTDISSQNVMNRTWFFEGATPTASSDSVVDIIYNTPGIYEVKLVVSNGVNTDSVIKTNYIEVFASPSTRNSLIEGFESNNSLNGSHWFTDEASDTWEVTNLVGANSNKSLLLTNHDDFSGRKTNLYSKPIDVSNANNLVLSFDYAFAKKMNPNTDRLRIYVSKNCGGSWLIRKTLSQTNIATVTDPLVSEFIPTNSEWDNVMITNINASYYTSDFMVKFEFTGGGGNNIYLDNINLYDPAQVGVEEEFELQVNLYPNPTNGVVNLDFNKLKHSPTISIYDLTGKLIQDQKFNGDLLHLEFSTEGLSKGTYILKVDKKENILLIVE